MKIYLIRHTETFGNLDKKFNGITESEYTQKGLRVKEKLINFIQNKDFECNQIYTSPISRAKNIASDIGIFLGLEPIVIDELKEYNFGIFEGLSPKEAQDQYPIEYDNWMNDSLNYVLENGESFTEKAKILHKWLKNVLKSKYSSIIIVSHGAVIRALLSYLLNLDLKDTWHINIPLGGILEIEFNHDFGILNTLIDLEKI